MDFWILIGGSTGPNFVDVFTCIMKDVENILMCIYFSPPPHPKSANLNLYNKRFKDLTITYNSLQDNSIFLVFIICLKAFAIERNFAHFSLTRVFRLYGLRFGNQDVKSVKKVRTMPRHHFFQRVKNTLQKLLLVTIEKPTHSR